VYTVIHFVYKNSTENVTSFIHSITMLTNLHSVLVFACILTMALNSCMKVSQEE